MIRKTFLLAAIASLSISLAPHDAARAQTAPLTGAAKWADSVAREIEAASDAGDATRLAAVKTLIDRALVAFPNDALLLHYRGYALNRAASLQDGLGHHDKVEALLIDAQTSLDQSNAIKPMAESHALLSSIKGRLIGFQPYKAMILGPQAGNEMSEALALAPNNPRVWLLRGMSSIFTPAAYGGGLAKAETELNKAIELFATDHPVAPAPSWGKAEAYVWLGQVYQKRNKNAEAIAAYNKALEIDPNMEWVRRVLLPSASGR